MKHCHQEYDEAIYRVIRQAAAKDGLPIKTWIAMIASEVAHASLGLPLPCHEDRASGTEVVGLGRCNGNEAKAQERPRQ